MLKFAKKSKNAQKFAKFGKNAEKHNTILQNVQNFEIFCVKIQKNYHSWKKIALTASPAFSISVFGQLLNFLQGYEFRIGHVNDIQATTIFQTFHFVMFTIQFKILQSQIKGRTYFIHQALSSPFYHFPPPSTTFHHFPALSTTFQIFCCLNKKNSDLLSLPACSSTFYHFPPLFTTFHHFPPLLWL